LTGRLRVNSMVRHATRRPTMPSDDEVMSTIEALVAEEHRLWDEEAAGRGTPEDRRRLAEVRLRLDQLWDLLRQRRAKEEFGLDPDYAGPRPERIVENYEQ